MYLYVTFTKKHLTGDRDETNNYQHKLSQFLTKQATKQHTVSEGKRPSGLITR